MTIIPFEEKYNQAVIDLIMAIQQDEFDLPISIEEQPDLLNIKASYQDKKGEFWIDLDDKKRVVGCIGLVSLSDSNVALKKMFVASNCRGSGLGRQLIKTFMIYCQKHDKKAIYLGTTSVFSTAQRFYQNLGFKEISKPELPSDFPLLDVDNRHYVYKIN